MSKHSFRSKLTPEEYANLQWFASTVTVDEDFAGDGLDARIVGRLIARGLITTPGHESYIRAFSDYDELVQTRKVNHVPTPTGSGVKLLITRRGELMLRRYGSGQHHTPAWTLEE